MVVTKDTAKIISTDVWLKLLRQHRAIAVIRCDDFSLAYKMALAVAAAGMHLIEITWNCDRPQQLIAQLRTELPHCTIGTGTILETKQLDLAIAAGAQFAFSPIFDPRLLKLCRDRYQIPFVPGIFTPTEAVQAWQYGAKAVKVFPIKSLGGAEYVKCLQGPLGHIPLIPTGGVTVANAPKMIEAGAIAVGISSNLFPPQAIANNEWLQITEQISNMLEQLHKIDS